MPHPRLPLAVALSLLTASVAVGQGPPPIERTFANGATIRFYGQIDKGVLQYDDGIDTESYAPIDNDNSNTRAGISYKHKLGIWDFENVNEIAYAPYSTSDINILQQTPTADDWDFTDANIRKIDFTLANDRRGKFWIGQGGMATDGIQEIDLSGTDVIAYSSVADSAAAQIIRFSDRDLSFEESLSDIAIKDAFSNFDGPRRVRVRYDTPELRGFVLAAAFGRDLLNDDPDVRDENIFDASVTYGSTLGDIEVAAGLGYYRQEDDTTDTGGSASALHRPTGLNVTVTAGNRDTDAGDGSYWYGKLGLLRKYLAWGDTAASVDYYAADDFFLDPASGITSSTSESWGLALVQRIERANTDIWLTWRSYDYADNAASYEDGQAVFGGARFRF